jgi:hypothetical protein
MKKDIFDLRLGESKRFDRAQAFFAIGGIDTIAKYKTYGVWYMKKKGVKYFYLKRKKDTSRTWYWSVEANHVFTTLEDAKMGIKHLFIKKYENLLEQRKKDVVRIGGILKDSNNFNVVDLQPSSYDKNRWNAVVKFKEEQPTTS